MEATKWKIDGHSAVVGKEPVQIQWENATFFTLHHNGKTFHGEVVKNQLESGLLTVKLNHRLVEIRKDGPLDALIASMGLDVPKVRKLKQLKAPMPGRVVGISVEIGQEVQVGEPLLTLEAMKMENVLKAEGVGVVKAIRIEAQQVVDKGSLLIEFE